ncbi:lactadherin-like [Xenia sp. Carnegie-2017]|uniref:lactadherin-like n=1 Tax=Xenia sp. Carnegie-2017 TaxID=2897299 RepID=UPI001F044A04|nr:lactadherin-like [Xenia sp. Carnegie-2017]
MSLNQCTIAIFLCLFTSDLWPFGLSINGTAPGREDVRFESSRLLQQTALKKLGIQKNEMNSNALQFFMSLTLMCCATAELPCNTSVGIENGDLPRHSYIASSFKPGHFAYLGRLNNKIRKINETKRVWGAWCADDSNKNQFIQVDLLKVRNVTGIATQGYLYGSVTSYKIMYSVNAKQWVDYVDNTTMKSKIFTANVDETKDSIVRHKLNHLLEAKYIRFNPITWDKMICMRIDVYACEIPTVKPTTQSATTEPARGGPTKVIPHTKNWNSQQCR